MNLAVVIEPLDEHRFRARLGDPLALAAEGATKQEALAALRRLLDQRLASGVDTTSLTIHNGKTMPTPFSAIWDENDPDVQDWLRIMEENRRLDDVEQGIER